MYAYKKKEAYCGIFFGSAIYETLTLYDRYLLVPVDKIVPVFATKVLTEAKSSGQHTTTLLRIPLPIKGTAT